MPLHLWLAFVAAAVVLLMIPGPTILTVISYSVSHGRRANIPLVTAVAMGDATALTLSLVGLGALLATSAFWFTLVKWVGGLYLLYLGIRMLGNREQTDTGIEAAEPVRAGTWRLFGKTYLVTALNPKGIVFFVAFLPQFLDPAMGHLVRQMWILAVTFVVLASINASLYAAFGQLASEVLARRGARRRFNLAGGSLLSAAGIWALLARR